MLRIVAKHVAYATCVASFDTDFVFVLLLYASMLASEDAINFYAMILLFVLLFYKSTNTKSFKLGGTQFVMTNWVNTQFARFRFAKS